MNEATLENARLILEDCKAKLAASGRRFQVMRLEGISFAWSKSKRKLGEAWHYQSLIKLSLPIFAHPENFGHFENTVRHEVAHIAVGPAHGHDETWKDCCYAIGAKPSRCADVLSKPFKFPGVRHKYPCQCGVTNMLTPILHKRTQSGQTRYCCPKCRRTIPALSHEGIA